MEKNTDIQPTGLADIRISSKTKRYSRIGKAIAGTSLAGAMLLGSCFGGPVSAATARAHTPTAPMSAAMVNSYRQIAWQAARRAGINPTLFERQIQQESGFNPGADSPAGAQGIAQFMPGTAADMGVNPWNPTSALYGAARLMGQLNRQFGGNYAKALAAYNAGPGAVQYATRYGGGDWLAWTPAETQNYVRTIMGW